MPPSLIGMPASFIRTAEVARILQVHRSTVHVWVHEGRLAPAGEMSGYYLWDREAVEAFAATLLLAPTGT